MKVVGASADGGAPGYCDHTFFANTSAFAGATAGQVYARFYVLLGDPVGTQHATFATLTDKNDNNGRLRLGFNEGVFVWNRESDDAYLPQLDMPDDAGGTINTSQSLTPPTDWFCVEFLIDEAAGTIDTWVNDNEVPGLVDTGTPVTDISTAWLSGKYANKKPFVTDLALGWEAYFGQAMTVWYDDVAVAAHRIGCSPPDP